VIPPASVEREWAQLRQQHVARGVVTAHPLIVARAEGARLWGADGVEYLDFVAGIGTLNVGHSHPRVVAAATDQLQRFTHSAFQVAAYQPYVELAERLNALVGFAQPTKTVLLTSGAEAVENAVKIARAYTGRPAVVAFDGAFHGRTLLGLSLTASNAAYRQNFGPFAPEVYHTPFPYEYRGWTTERALEALDELFATRIPADRVAAIIIEPQLGEGGFIPAPIEFLRELRRIASRHGIVLIADEIQCGFGRTGEMFGFQHAGIAPDLVVLAKSLAAGLPLSAVVGRTEVVDGPAPGGLGGTYGGNPVACAAALAVLRIFEEENLVERARAIGGRLRAGLLALQSRCSHVGDVRGLGAMLAIELVEDRDRKTPATTLAARIIEAARARGLLLLTCGRHKNVVRLLAPLVATMDQIDAGLARLDSAVDDVL
jgi:4-aminobutyrate aminotransferase / (S)-3-amino-2-methylpropionate transaminase / 5-aminovalerate transaminase